MAQDTSRPAQRSHCRKKGQLHPSKVCLTPNSEPPQLLPQMAGEKKQNKYPSEMGLFPTTCYDTRTKCSLCSKTVMSSAKGGGEHVPTPHIISPAGFTHLCRSSGHQSGWVGRKGQTLWEGCSLWAHALNTTGKSLCSSCGVTGTH